MKSSNRTYGQQNGVEIIAIYEEANISGRKVGRKQFDRMIAAAIGDDRPVDMVIFYNLSRFSRRLRTQVNAEYDLEKAGVRLVSLTEAFGDDATGKMMRSMVGVMNEKYALDASLFTRRDRRGNARAGYWNGGPVPFGYESRTIVTLGHEERRRLFVVEDEAAVVRLIHDLAEAGTAGTPMGTRSIAQHLNALGHTLRGKPFFHSNVDGILTREHYLGCYRDRTAGDDGSVPDEDRAIVVACPQIIDPTQRARIVTIRARNAPRVTPPRIKPAKPLHAAGDRQTSHRRGSVDKVRAARSEPDEAKSAVPSCFSAYLRLEDHRHRQPNQNRRNEGGARSRPGSRSRYAPASGAQI